MSLDKKVREINKDWACVVGGVMGAFFTGATGISFPYNVGMGLLFPTGVIGLGVYGESNFDGELAKKASKYAFVGAVVGTTIGYLLR